MEIRHAQAMTRPTDDRGRRTIDAALAGAAVACSFLVLLTVRWSTPVAAAFCVAGYCAMTAFMLRKDNR